MSQGDVRPVASTHRQKAALGCMMVPSSATMSVPSRSTRLPGKYSCGPASAVGAGASSSLLSPSSLPGLHHTSQASS